jgi:RNA polymerase sigma factor (sigma-70 family)
VVSAAAEFERIYARFFAPIQAKSRRLLSSRQAVDDVTQEAFLRLWQWRDRPALDADDATRTILAWLYRTCTRLAIDALRERKRVVLDGAALEHLPCGVDTAAATAARAAVMALVEVARNDELEAAILCRVDGLSQLEAGLVLGVSERSVRRLIARFDERTASLREEFA